MTLTEIRALPQELVEAFDRDYRAMEPFVFMVEDERFACWMRGALGHTSPSGNPEDSWYQWWSMGRAYFLGKGGKG